MFKCKNKSDLEIVNLVASGNLDAFYCVVSKYEKNILKYIMRITNIDLEDAENLLQEVFLKVYKNINEYNGDFQLSTWIYRIAHNITIDYSRKYKNKIHVSIETDDKEYSNLIEILDSGVNIEHDFKKKELRKKIAETLNLLEDRYKEVLILKFLEEKSYDEISDILKIPSGSVATLINRGKKQFQVKAQDNNLIKFL